MEKILIKAASEVDNSKFIEVNGNKVAFTIQDGVIPKVGVNGIQCMDLILFTKNLFEELNKAIPCRENSLTITHLDDAYNWQIRRNMNREKRMVEGTEKI